MTRAFLLALSLPLAGCAGSFSIPPQPPVVERLPSGGGAEVISAPGGATEVIEPAQPALEAQTCYARARAFKGLVPMPCGLASMARP